MERDEPEANATVQLVQDLGFSAMFASSLTVLQNQPSYRDAAMPLVLVPDVASSDRLAQAVADFVRGEHGHAYIVYVADRIEAATYKGLVQSGAAEWIRWDALAGELRGIVGSLHQTATPERSARIITCWPSKGGVGNTLLAGEIAVQLATKRKRGGQRVAALELSLQGGTLADSLNLEPRFDLQGFIRNPDRLDQQLIEAFASAHSPRLDIFAPPPCRLPTEALKADVVFGFLDAISTRYDVIIIDHPVTWQPWTDNILEGSDAVILTGGSTVPAVRRILARLEQIDALAVGTDKLAVAVTQCETDIFGRITRRAELDRALLERRVFYVPRDVAAVDAALDSGRPLGETAPGSKVTKMIRSIADWTETVTARSSTQPAPDPTALEARR